MATELAPRGNVVPKVPAFLLRFDGMLKADEEYFQAHNEPLFSSHMLDLSEEKDEENIATCKKYLERMAKVRD